MSIIERCVELLGKYGIELVPYSGQLYLNQIGIGDLLFIKLLQENGVIGRVYINLAVMQKYFNDLLNALEFRIRLLNDLECDVGYVFSTDLNKNNVSYLHMVKTHTNSMKIRKQICDVTYDVAEKYVCFHTKLRLSANLVHKIPGIKTRLRDFYTNFSSKYVILLLGEKIFPNTVEGNQHGITTIYDELLNLRNNNCVIDLTENSIYDNLSYDNFKRDVDIIKNAECNVSVGCGGTFCMEITLGKKNIVYLDTLDLSFYFKTNRFDDTVLHTDLNSFFDDINDNI